jgi:peptide chain release factor
VADTERQFSQNRRLALARIRARLEREDQDSDRAALTGRWRIHDDLVRGDPVRTERP